MSSKKFYNDVEIKADILLENETGNRALTTGADGKVTSSAVTDTELGYLSGVTSSVQTQITDAQADATQALADAAAAQADIDNHIADTTDAHDASAISVVPTGNLAASQVQAALVELQGDIDALQALDPMEYKGNWNASTNTPTLADGTGDNGDLYRVSVAGTQDLGSGSITFAIGDKIVYNGTDAVWEKWDTQDEVTSVNGQTGAVILDTGDISEGSNLYFTDERAQDAVGTILTDSNTIDFTYTDATPSITADVKTQMSITSDSSGIKLQGDSATPGNTKYYGTNGAGTKGFYDIPAVGSAGDIQETSFSMANNQASPANVTGLSFNSAVVRSFDALVSVEIDASSDLYEMFKLQGIQRGSDFQMSVEGTGDDSGVSFDITSGGQVTYTSTNVAGFSSGTIKFRAFTTTV
jgi:hypothetical protein